MPFGCGGSFGDVFEPVACGTLPPSFGLLLLGAVDEALGALVCTGVIPVGLFGGDVGLDAGGVPETVSVAIGLPLEFELEAEGPFELVLDEPVASLPIVSFPLVPASSAHAQASATLVAKTLSASV
jgi:hypothetical protein